MKRVRSIFVFVLLICLLASCATVKPYDKKNHMSRLDSWNKMSGCFVEDGYVYSVGVGHYSTLKNARQSAILDAQIAIAQFIGTEIYSSIEEQADEADIEVGDLLDGTSMQWLTSMRNAKTIINGLSKLQVFDGLTEKTEDGNSYYYYVLMGISEEELNSEINNLIDQKLNFSSQEAAELVKNHFNEK